MGICKASALPKYITMLLYGDNRAGKTYFLGSNSEVVNCQPSLIIDADNGYETIRKHFPNQDIYTFDNSKKILRHIAGLPELIKKGGYKAVFLDTISSFTFNLLEEISGGGAVQIQHWNQLFKETIAFVRGLKQVAQIFIATGFPTFITDKDGNALGVTPLLQGKKFPTMLMNEFNTIAFLSVRNIRTGGVDKTERTLKAEANGFSLAGDRFAAIGTLKDPKFVDVYDRIYTVTENQ